MVTLLLGHWLPNSYTCRLSWSVCVVSVFCCDEFGSGGVPVVGCRQVLLFNFWGVSRMSVVVWDSTGLICKVNGYLSRTGFSLLDDYGRFSAVVLLRIFLDLANLFWLKVLLVPVGV